MKQHILDALTEAKTALEEAIASEALIASIEQAAMSIIETVESGGRIFSCGNGGSLCDAMHFAEEMTGRFRKSRRALSATAISDPGHMSCVANDFGYDQVFSRYLEANARRGDLLVALTTSGESRSVLLALQACSDAGLKSVLLTGKPLSSAVPMADICICTPGGTFADRVQELHIKVLHILIECVERRLCGENYAAA